MIKNINYNTFKERYMKIKTSYPETMAWIKHKANWEHITLFSVVAGYWNHIELLMKQEEGNRK